MTGSGGDVGACFHLALRQAQDEVKAGRCEALALPCVVLSRVAVPRLGLPRLGLRCSALRCRDVFVRLSHITSASALSWSSKCSAHRLARRLHQHSPHPELVEGRGRHDGLRWRCCACLHPALRQAQGEVKAGICEALTSSCLGLPRLVLRCCALPCREVLVRLSQIISASALSWSSKCSSHRLARRFRHTALILSLSKGGGGMTGSGGDVGACLHLALRQGQDEVKAGRCGALASPCLGLRCSALLCREVTVRLSQIISASALSWSSKCSSHRLARRLRQHSPHPEPVEGRGRHDGLRR